MQGVKIGKIHGPPKRKKWENTWPSFYRDLLFGKKKTEIRQFHDIAGAPKFWQLVLETIRPFWKNRLEKFEINGVKPYALCIEEYTPQFLMIGQRILICFEAV